MSIDVIEAGLKVSDDYLSTLDKLIKDQILNSWPDVIPGIDPIARNLDNLIHVAQTALRNAENAIKSQIEPLIKNAIPSALDVVGNLTRVLDDNLTRLIENVATTDDILAVAIKTLSQHSPQLAHWFYTNVAGSFGNIALGILETLEHESPETVNPILDELLAVKELPPWLHNALAHARQRKAPVFAFILPAIILAALIPSLGALGEPIAQAVKQGAWAATPTKVAEPATLIDALIRKSIQHEYFLAEMKKSGYDHNVSDLMLTNRTLLLDPEIATRARIRGVLNQAQWQSELVHRGYDPDRANHFYDASLTPLGEDDARSLFLRNMVDASHHDTLLERLGYTAQSAELRRQLYFYIPGPQDLIHMGIRNVFNDEIVKRFTLDEDKPPAFVKAASQQGISDYWAGKYWQAHWIMPGREAFFEMFQRTVDKPLDENADKIVLSDGTIVYNIMGRNTLNLALRDVDTPPFYRDKLTEIAYHPLTRIDIRRLAAMGLLTHSQVERAYLDLGYNQTRARELADFTDALNARAKKDETSQLTDGLRRQILRFYAANKLDADAAKTALNEIGASDAEIAVYLAEADVIREAELATMVETGIGKLYVAGFIDDKDAIKRLTNAGVPVNAQTALFAKWDLEIEYRGGTTHIHQHKELTKTEVLEALTDSLIDQPTAENMLEDLGYDKIGAEAEISLALYKSAKATKTAQVDAIKASYVNGTIEELDASNRLDALFVPANQRDAFLTTWSLQRETRTERIPVATLRDMAKRGFITEEETLAHLKRHRYTNADAALVLRFWKNAGS